MKRLDRHVAAMLVLGGMTLPLGCAEAWIERQPGLADHARFVTIEPLDFAGEAISPASTEPPRGPEATVDSLLRRVSDRDAGVVSVDLDGFRSALMQNNLELQVARFDPTLAATRVLAEYGRLDTTLTANAIATREIRDANENNEPQFALNSEYLDAAAEFRVPLATGAEIRLEGDLYRYETSYIDQEGNTVLPSATSFPSNLNAAVTVPLLKGSGYDATLGPIVVAAYDQRLSMLDLRVLLSRLLSSSEIVYWQLERAWRAVQIQTETLRDADRLVSDTETLARAGIVPAAQRYRAELTVNQRQAELIDADLDLRRDMRSVKIIMNRPDLPLDGEVIVRPDTRPLLTAFDFDRAGLATMAIENRAELIMAEYELSQDDVRLRMARNALLPELDLEGSVGLLGISDSVGNSIDSMIDGDYPPGWKIGFHFRIPLQNRRDRANYQATVIGRLQTLAEQREIRMMVIQEVYDAVDLLELGWARIVATRNAEADARRNLEAQRRLLQTGSTTVYEVSVAINDLGNARLETIDSETAYQIALIELAEATGTTLGRQAVEVVAQPMPEMSDEPMP
jgi:outer membrane protein